MLLIQDFKYYNNIENKDPSTIFFVIFLGKNLIIKFSIKEQSTISTSSIQTTKDAEDGVCIAVLKLVQYLPKKNTELIRNWLNPKEKFVHFAHAV